jgi:hypothetical protein
VVSGLVNDGGQVAMPCFAAGTFILTESGAVPVERLVVGQLVPTQDGAMLPIAWIGRRSLDCERHSDPVQVWPVCIEAHAFGANLPQRDLYLSPDHAVFAEGVLIPVRHLVNGGTVRQVALPSITYLHIELERHSVIWAEGLPVETYLDTGDRQAFADAGAVLALHPVWGGDANAVAMLMEARGYAPLRVSGAEVERVRARLAPGEAKRARALRKPRASRRKG